MLPCNKCKSQFLLAKGEHSDNEDKIPAEIQKYLSQFLIGKVEQEAGLSPKGEFYMWVLKSQFLLGKV